jgi:hypothetical protein
MLPIARRYRIEANRHMAADEIIGKGSRAFLKYVPVVNIPRQANSAISATLASSWHKE